MSSTPISTRVLIGTLALVALALVTLVASALTDSADGPAGQGAVYAQAAECWRVSGIIGEARVDVLVCPEMVPAPVQPTVTPSATATRTPTPTPSLTPLPTNTPRPTVTPTPSATPTATWTPTARPTDAMPTPTPERTVLPTAAPQPTVAPPDQVCYGTVRADTLRIRTDAGTTAAVVGGLKAGQVVRVLAVKYVGADEWANVQTADLVTGWAAAWYQGTVYIEYDSSPECLIIRFGEGLSRGVGWTVTTGASADTLNAAAADLRRAGYTPALTVAGETNSIPTLLAGGWAVNWRPFYDLKLGDCGVKDGLAPEQAARQRIAALRDYVNTMLSVWGVKGSRPPRLWVQVENECSFPSAYYAARWIIAAAGECTALGWRCTPAVWSTGNPAVQWIPELTGAMAALVKGGHAWGMNVGPYLPELMLCDDQHPITGYTTWLGRRIREVAPRGLLIWVTESARGNAEQPVDLDDFACFVRKGHAEGIYNVLDMWHAGLFQWREGSQANWSREQIAAFARRLAQ